MRILLVEDEKPLSSAICQMLKKEQFSVDPVYTGTDGLDYALSDIYDAVILDVMLPGMDGFAVCEQIRKRADTPIFMLSAKTQKNDKLNGLLLGADDYMEKPYDIDLLLAKIAGIFRRRYALDVLVTGDLSLNSAARTASRAGKPLEMTAKEFDLLLLLAENPGKTLTKEFLFSSVWGSDSESEQQTLTVHIKRLREKIEDDPKHPQRIKTVWGVGYQFT